MKVFNFIILFCCLFSFLTADEFPKYKIIDLGVFGSDQSGAYEVNEEGQVLGTYYENNDSYLFLWDEIKGLTVIDYPQGKIEIGKLNNKGQIAFSCRVGPGFINKIIYWDANNGFWELESSKEYIQLIDFNDNGQVLGSIGEDYSYGWVKQIMIWDHGKKINLTTLFREKIPGKWGDFKATSLNNRGHIVITAYKQAESPQDKDAGYKLFIWKEGSFSQPEICINHTSWGAYLDDDENIIIDKNYFVNPSKLICIPCSRCNKILNGAPIAVDCLPSILKKDRHGNFYFSQGIQIKRLLEEKFPYYHDYIEICDQNSKGYVVGSIDTIYSRQAFLAIPESINN